LATLLHEPPVEAEQPRKPRRWVRRGTVLILLLAGLIWAGDATISLLVQHSRLRAKITARLQAAFGRPVEVGNYGFSIWGRPVLEANSVRIGEDPRFGNEYFIRADSISINLLWSSLLRGHIGLGTLSVSGASLNLVRNSDGEWNLAEWLPKPAVAGFPSVSSPEPSNSSPALQFHRIDISDSRINFKRGAEKLAFALVDVNGSMRTAAAGKWRIDFTAAPWRAAVITQQPGLIQVTGQIGGTSSRLRPAALQISWTNASISDCLRLARGDDYGIRGDLSVSISAHTEPSQPVNGWVLDGKADIRGLHRWDMAARPDNPALNLIVNQVLLDPSLSEARLSNIRIEASHSIAKASAAFNWTEPPRQGTAAGAPPDVIAVSSSKVDLRDLLDSIRAFHPGVPDATAVRGMVDAQLRFTGWPPKLTSASVTGDRAELNGPGLSAPARIEPIALHYSPGAISLQPAKLAWGKPSDPAAAAFRIDASPRRRASLFPSWHIAGSADDARGITAIAAALGLNLSRGWDLQGPLSCDLHWQGGAVPWNSHPVGTISLGIDGVKPGASLRAPFLNLPIEQIRARVELKPGVSQIALSSAKAFGSNWTGSFERQTAVSEWMFALSAEHLAAADLDRWLNPRWRESFLDRMLPFLGAQSKPVSPEQIRASGTLKVDDFSLDPFDIRHLAGNLRVDGRHLELSDAQAQFYGGQVSGSFRANLSAIPDYHADIGVSSVNGALLASTSTALKGLRAEAIEGHASLDAKGATRDDLIASLICRGTASATGIGMPGFEKAFGAIAQSPSYSQIQSASAAFTCARREIQFQKLSFMFTGGRAFTADGNVGFNRSIDLRLQESGESSNARSAATFRITGDLTSPQIARVISARRAR
jgi:hypothetical protein